MQSLTNFEMPISLTILAWPRVNFPDDFPGYFSYNFPGDFPGYFPGDFPDNFPASSLDISLAAFFTH
jgi:hypothetical protein